MVEQDREKFAKLISGLCDYYGKALGETILDLYWGSLLEFDFQDIELAAASHLKDDDRGRFMPKIADFVYAIEGSADEAAAIAWDAVLRNRGGTDEAAAAALASMGGWSQAIGRQNEKDIPFIAKDFQLRYKAYKSRAAFRQNLGIASISVAKLISIAGGKNGLA